MTVQIVMPANTILAAKSIGGSRDQIPIGIGTIVIGGPVKYHHHEFLRDVQFLADRVREDEPDPAA